MHRGSSKVCNQTYKNSGEEKIHDFLFLTRISAFMDILSYAVEQPKKKKKDTEDTGKYTWKQNKR